MSEPITAFDLLSTIEEFRRASTPVAKRSVYMSEYEWDTICSATATLKSEYSQLSARVQLLREWQANVLKVTNTKLLSHGVCYCKECIGNIERQRASNEAVDILRGPLSSEKEE